MSSTTINPPARGAALVEERAVGWLAEHRDLLDPTRVATDQELFARKALVETALLVGLRARLDGRLDGPYAALLQTITEVAGRRSYRELVSRDRRALLLYAGTYAALRLCGREDTDFRDVIERAVQGRYAAAFERVPYRHLDLLHTLELAGIGCEAPDVESVLPLTLVAADPNVLELTVGDTYAITHAIFYATDFGQRPAPWPSGVTDHGVVVLLEVCLVLARGREDADMVGELLMCLTCLGDGDSPTATSARRWLADWQEPSGRLLGPPGVVPSRLTEADPAWADWATAYHTTIVAALESLLHRTHARAGAGDRFGPRLPVAGGGRPAVQAACRDSPVVNDEALHRAASYLLGRPGDGHLGVRSTVWAAEALAAVGAARPARAAVRMLHLGLGPKGDPGAMALQLAALADRLGDPWGADTLDAAADLLVDADPRDTTLDTARHHLRSTGRATGGAGGVVEALDLDAGEDVRARAIGLVADLLRRGPAPRVAPAVAMPAIRLLAVAGRSAVEEYDLGLLCLVLRGLTRLPAPVGLVRDATDFLLAQQDRTGAFGATLSDDPVEQQDLQVQWTTMAVAALLEVRQAQGRAASATQGR